MADGRVARRLFAILALFYVAITGGHVYSPDGLMMARVTESLVERGELAVADPGYPPGFLTPGRGGRSYAKYGVGFSVLAVPGYLVGDALARWAPEGAASVFLGPRFLWYDATDPDQAWRFFGASLTNAWITALAAALLFLLARELDVSPRGALALALLVALGSPLVVYAKSFFTEPTTAAALTGFALGLARWQRTGRRRPALAAGAGLGLAAFVKLAHLVLWPVAAVAVLWGLRDRPEPWWRRWRTAWPFAVGPLIGLVLIGAVNAARFGSPWASGYGDELELWTTAWTEGLQGLLFSPGRGLLVFFPVVLLALACGREGGRRFGVVAGFAWGALASLLALYSRWHGWDGGWCWGPRFLVPVIPLLGLLAWPAFETLARRTQRWAATVAVGWSAVVNLLGTTVPFTAYHDVLRREWVGSGYLVAARWSWQLFPPLAYLVLPKSFFLLGSVLATKSAWWLAVAFGAGIGLALQQCRRLWTEVWGGLRYDSRMRPDWWIPIASASALGLLTLVLGR